jgi:hypothetical protein
MTIQAKAQAAEDEANSNIPAWKRNVKANKSLSKQLSSEALAGAGCV